MTGVRIGENRNIRRFLEPFQKTLVIVKLVVFQDRAFHAELVKILTLFLSSDIFIFFCSSKRYSPGWTSKES